MIDLRSDTVTKPTAAMRQAMAEADVGDDVLGEDPTVRLLEERGAALLGKEDCLFTASGTMSNLLAVLTLCRPGEQAIVHRNSHLYNLEAASMARVCGVQARPVDAPGGRFDRAELLQNLVSPSLQTARTSLLCLENTFDLNRGLVMEIAHMEEVAVLAHAHGAGVYLDGARLLNAAVALGDSPARLCRMADLVALCLTKGLSCPVGSLLAGSRENIETARHFRQALGGGWRQAGILAAAGLVALKDYSHLAVDHQNARTLAEGLAGLGLKVEPAQGGTNIVHIDTTPAGMPGVKFVERLKLRGILAKPLGGNCLRMVTHRDVTSDDVASVLAAAALCLARE